MWQEASSFLDKPLRPFQGVWHPGDECSRGWMAAEEKAGQWRAATNLGARWKQVCSLGMEREYGVRAGGESKPI